MWAEVKECLYMVSEGLSEQVMVELRSDRAGYAKIWDSR